MKIQRYYFMFYIVMIIPNFFILSSTGLEWYSVFTCLHPVVIISIILWSISINAQNLERKSGAPGDSTQTKAGGNEGKGTDWSDSSFVDEEESEMSVLGGANQHESQYRAVDFAHKEGEIDDKDLGSMMNKEQLNEFKESVKNHILEYIIAGLQQSSHESAKNRNLYEKDLGFGEPANSLVQEPTAKNGDKKAETNINYIGRHTKNFFSFKQQSTTSMISIKDPNAEALVLEGLVLGHPDILRRFNITLKQEELNKQCKVEKVYKGENQSNGISYEFVELAPEVFSMIRKIQNVSELLVS